MGQLDSGGANSDDLIGAFKQFDRDASGTLPGNELRYILTNMVRHVNVLVLVHFHVHFRVACRAVLFWGWSCALVCFCAPCRPPHVPFLHAHPRYRACVGFHAVKQILISLFSFVLNRAR